MRGDKTRLVESVRWQVEKVAEAMPEVPVRGVLCFIDARWGMLADPFTVHDVLVTWPKNLAKRLAAEASGRLDAGAVAGEIERRFTPR